MKNIMKKVILIILSLAVLAVAISIVKSYDDKAKKEDYKSEIVSEENGDALQIENVKITNLTERSGTDLSAVTDIKNISDLNLSQINIYYNELDKKDNEVSGSKIVVDMTLNPKDTMEIQFLPKDYTNTIDIKGYTYIVEDCEVYVDLTNNNIAIRENEKYLENSKNYEVLSINKVARSKTYNNEDTSYSINIKNISKKNLGNIVLKVGEINKENKFVRIDHVTYNSLLKPNDNGEITLSLSNPQYDVKILGYTYDDMESKSNVDIDLTTHKVNIINNKQ
ncbi:MAG: hypothetical protein RSG52_05810 [Terrisporobacter sp.]|uniref:hypothetical protein n=1 Tax=Terrisporobacter sp. TaxID=1965305 RepID=UPI002FC76AA9